MSSARGRRAGPFQLSPPPSRIVPQDRHSQLSQVVARELREQIVSAKVVQGQFLRIDAIAKTLNVSMTPVREGLLLLQSEGFVRLIPRRGFVVNSFGKKDVLDLFWAQAAIGGELAARAAIRMANADIARLEQLQPEYEAAIRAGDEDVIARLGHEFHRSINLSAASPRLALLLGGLTKRLPNRFYARIEGRLSDAVDSHPMILDAIKRRDPDEARRLMRQHVSGGGDHLVTMLERQGAWAAEAPAPPLDPD